MKDKASEKTEDEVLDQTFGGGDQTFDSFDEEMTNNAKGSGESSSAEVFNKKPGASSNTVLAISAGVASVLVAVYIFAIKPMLNPVPQQNVTKISVPDINTVAVDGKPVSPVSPESPEKKVARDFLTGNGAVVSTASPSIIPTAPMVVASAPIAVMVVTPVALPTVTSTPVAPPPTIVTPTIVAIIPEVKVTEAVKEVVKENDSSAATISELGKRFEVQGQQFRIALDDVGTKVSNLEKFRDEQLVTNKNVEQRLSGLEGKKSLVTSEPTSKGTVKKLTKAGKNKTFYKKEIREVKKENINVLVDKSEVKDARVKEVVIKEYQNDYNIHSIYGGRVWLKNTDGSLSTYISGDRLPSGELIKNIDDEKYSIITDKRTLSKK